MLFFFVSILKALSYALNEPCKEMLYIPTSDTIRCVRPCRYIYINQHTYLPMPTPTNQPTN